MGKIELLCLSKKGKNWRIPIQKSEMTMTTDPTVNPKQIGERMGVNFNEVSLKEFEMGMQEEMEHKDITGGDPEITAKIVMVHLKEDPQYYTKLKSVMSGPQDPTKQNDANIRNSEVIKGLGTRT